MSHGSLFTGIGLLDYGLSLAGLPDPVWVVESDDWRRDTVLARRFPGAVRHDDVRTVGARNLDPVRLVAGGFPCKGASTAGKRNGFDHPETVLWKEMLRIVRELGPQYVLLENVANLLALHHGAVWGEVLGDLATLGYDVTWDCIPAAAVGAPHRRDRVFAVATHAAETGRGAGTEQLPTGGLPSVVAAGREDAADTGRERGELRGGPELVASPGGRAQGQARERQRARDAAGGTGADVADPCGGGWGAAEHDVREGQPDAGRIGQVVADPEDRGSDERTVGDGAQAGGLELSAGRDVERRGVPVEWGSYGPAIERWERTLGRVAPEPLVRRVDDRSASRVERSRLSALGDGVQVQCGYLVGRYLVERFPELLNDVA